MCVHTRVPCARVRNSRMPRGTFTGALMSFRGASRRRYVRRGYHKAVVAANYDAVTCARVPANSTAMP